MDDNGELLMRATADSIWQVPVYLPYLQPPLAADIVAAAEEDIGFRLPRAYLDLIKKQNGGYIRYSLPESPHDTIAGIGPHFPSLTRVDWEDCQGHVSYSLEGLIPFDGDGHWHLCLDYRSNSQNPAVTYADIECNRETRVAESFADYLVLLRLRGGDEFVMQAATDIADVTAELSRVLGVRFDPPDTWANGYPVYRARMALGEDPQWLWICPNAVPRGFVRKDDSRYSELKDLLPGTAERYPGLPADSYLLDSTAGVKAKVVDACGRIGLTIRPLREFLEFS
jgi:hypothetical protein